jgi:hypothetical protein
MPSAAAAWWTEFRTLWLSVPARRLGLLAALAALHLAVYGTQRFRVEATLALPARALGRSAELVLLPPVPALRAASLGHQGLIADLLFIRATHYFVDHLLSDAQLPHLERYLDAIWGLDAHNKTTYRWGAQVIKFGQRIDETVNQRANRIARLGIAHFPHDPWLYHEIAYNLFAYAHLVDEAEAGRRRALALRYLEVAYKLPGFDLDPNYLATLYERAGAADDAVSAALAAYAMGTAEQRRELRLRLQERDRADAAGELAWLDRFRRRDWPWLAEPLAQLVGPRRLTTPPQDASRPENWLAEPPTPPALVEEAALAGARPIAALLLPGAPPPLDEALGDDGSPWTPASRGGATGREAETTARQDEVGAAPAAAPATTRAPPPRASPREGR